jgi:hypothetical protein
MPRKTRNDTTFVRDLEDSGCEWIGGLLPAPGFITGEGEPYRPLLALWMELPEGFVVGQEVVRPSEVDGALAAVLLDAMKKPMEGRPRRPASIRVGDMAAADDVRTMVGDAIPVTFAPVPELDDVLASLAEYAARRHDGSRKSDEDGDVEQASYFEDGRVCEDAIAELFAATRALATVAPWEFVVDDQPIRLDVPALGVEGACVSILGALDIARAVAIFPSLAARDRFCAAGEALPAKPGGPVDLGTSQLNLCLERAADLPAQMRREAIDHGWPVADAGSYPLVRHIERDGLLRPLTESDVRIAAACASALSAFCARHRDLLDVDPDDPYEEPEDFEPVCETYTSSSGVQVRLTYPYEAFEMFDVDDPASGTRATSRVGRNDPCPCGSGKKYKKCHLATDEARRRAEHQHGRSARDGGGAVLTTDEARRGAEQQRPGVHDMDNVLVECLLVFARNNFGNRWKSFDERLVRGDELATSTLLAPFAAYHGCIDETRILDFFLAAHGTELPAVECAWLAAQRDAWLSLWEVRSVEPGKSIELEDLLTGEVRRVEERRASESLVVRDVILARVVAYGSAAVICGCHPQPLPPREAAEVVRRASAYLERKLGDPKELLGEEKVGRYLIKRWMEAVDEMIELRSRPPEIHNNDGDRWLQTIDVFEVKGGTIDEIGRRIAAMRGARVEMRDDTGARAGESFRGHADRSVGEGTRDDVGKSADDSERIILFFRAPKGKESSLDSVMIGRVSLTTAGLRVETSSTERSDELRGRIEDACAGLIEHRSREQIDPLTDPMAFARPAPPSRGAIKDLPPEVRDQAVLEFKKGHYAKWLDEKIPALGGRTPRQATRTAGGRKKLDLLLKEIENGEQRLPPGQRFDVGSLRHELGLEG